MSTTGSKILTYYLIQSYLMKYKSITPPPLMFSWEIFGFFRSSYRTCFMKKALLKFLQYSQESCWPATLLKTYSNTGVFLWILRNFNSTYFQEHLLSEQLLLLLRSVINRLRTIKLLTVQLKFINLYFISKRLIHVT